jgi:poly(A) polymerase
LDFATEATPQEITKIVKNYADNLWQIGARFGTIGLEKNGFKIEITTFRQDKYQVSSRQPEVEFSQSIEADLSRRDFTINTMAIKIPEGEFIDPFSGFNDLKARILKTPIAASDSFSDDPLRMLRAIRFTSTLLTVPSEEVISTIKTLRNRLEIVSAERIKDEFTKLMTGIQPAAALTLLVETRLAEVFLPELLELVLCYDPQHRHKDLLEHTLMVVNNVEADLSLRLAALLHDIGKPKTRTIVGNQVHFYHHEIVGAKMAKKRLEALRYPNKVIDEVVTIISMHMRFHTYRLGWADKAIRKYVRDCGEFRDKINTLVRADCTTRDSFQARKYSRLLDELEKRIVELEAKEESAKIRPPIDGNEVMEFLKISPGPKVGEILKHLLEARLEGAIETKEEAYKYIEKLISEKKVVIGNNQQRRDK